MNVLASIMLFVLLFIDSAGGYQNIVEARRYPDKSSCIKIANFINQDVWRLRGTYVVATCAEFSARPIGKRTTIFNPYD